jgi:ABC-type sugar transport system ATPase subunit
VLLSLRGIQKNFGGVKALRNGSLDVNAGEVHLLMGENGAGKSTMMKIVAGMLQHDAGDMLWQGNAVSFANPSEASANGIAMVHQESLLAPHLTVAENIFLGHETSSPLGWVNRGRLVDRAGSLIAAHNFPLDASARVEKLTPAGKQLVEICRAVAQGSNLLIFDEPTSSLSEAETKEVFRLVKQFRDRNAAVIYITHRLDELRSVGDRVTILRDGQTVHSCALTELSSEQLIQHMVGRPVSSIYHRDPIPPGDVLLRLENLTRGFVQDISFEIRAGEIVGLGFGLDPFERGAIEVAGRSIRPGNPRDAVAAGIALIPEDRQHHGLVLRLPIAYNISMPDMGRVTRAGIIQKGEEQSLAEEYRQKLRIKCSSPAQLAGRLSGGNQQKIVIAKWVARGARVFLFDEPTRGIDVGAKQEVFEQMDPLARAGAAILMVSSELPELIQVADRILVMRQGRITGELRRPSTQEDIMRLAAFQGHTPTAVNQN